MAKILRLINVVGGLTKGLLMVVTYHLLSKDEVNGVN
jgi:hypothetical protein